MGWISQNNSSFKSYRFTLLFVGFVFVAVIIVVLLRINIIISTILYLRVDNPFLFFLFFLILVVFISFWICYHKYYY